VTEPFTAQDDLVAQDFGTGLVRGRFLDTGGAVFNVKAFGATGDGVTDDTAAIQAAIDVANSAGGGIVDGGGIQNTYLVSIAVHPNYPDVATALVLRDNVTLQNMTVKLAAVPNEVPSGCNSNWQLHIVSTWTPYNAALGGTKTVNLNVRDVVIDGNGANQTFVAPNQAMGLFIGATRGFWADRVTVKNFYGTGSAAPGETDFFVINGSTDGHYTNCHAICDDASESATGFGAVTSTSVEYVGCTAWGMKYNAGFADWQCTLLRFANCHAYLNVNGFNTEKSLYVSYVNCHSGGTAAPVNTAMFASGSDLGNSSHGFLCQGSRYVTYGAGCQAISNGGHGFYVITNVVSPALTSDYIFFDNCLSISNTGTGYKIAASQTHVLVTATCRSVSDGAEFDLPNEATDNIHKRASDAPVETYQALNGGSGLRVNIEGGGATDFFRLQDNGTTIFRVAKAGQLGVANAVAASTPGTVVKKIQILDQTGAGIGYIPIYDAIT